MTDYLTLAAAYLGKTDDDILSLGVYADHVAVVVDNGIAGCPKYYIPLSDLHALIEPDPVDDLGIYDLPYRELQELAKEYDIQANQKRKAIIAELEALFGVDEEE